MIKRKLDFFPRTLRFGIKDFDQPVAKSEKSYMWRYGGLKDGNLILIPFQCH